MMNSSSFFVVDDYSLLISIPNAMYATTIEFNDTGRTACYHAWPDGPTFESTQEYM